MKTYSTAFAFRRALEDRLAAAAKAEGIDLLRMRRQVSFYRLLVRLFAEGNRPWRLKGGYALELKLAMARTTWDLDLGLTADGFAAADLLEVLQAAAGSDAGEFFVFTIGEPTMDLDGAPYGGSRQREPFEWIEPREWLGFAGMSAGMFPSILREEHFAQKIHAYTLPRGERPNTRVKDLVDLMLLIDAGGLERERLIRDLDDTFRRRKTHAVRRFWSLHPISGCLCLESWPRSAALMAILRCNSKR
ncbi:nucleotidyl transferase AbiEii/AbiGii toxin family protein [Luteolibacter sp. Populi]|uniref:nucleotidyl transferase AbiEii/AbiGii toxin family protein n=1 Tax=Luteolibacter sp. Populi TaxID=3230487 RepID=UPI003466D5A7